MLSDPDNKLHKIKDIIEEVMLTGSHAEDSEALMDIWNILTEEDTDATQRP